MSSDSKQAIDQDSDYEMNENSDQSIDQEELYIDLIKAIKENNILQINNLLIQAKNDNIDLINFQINFQPIHQAAWEGNIKIFLLLQQNGANVDAISNNQMNCLTIAVLKQHVNLVSALIATVKDPNFISKRGTALHIAAKLDNEQIMELLLKHPNIDTNIKFKNKRPIQIAGSMTKQLLMLQERIQKSYILISNSFMNSDSLLHNQNQPQIIIGFAQKVGWLGFKYSSNFLFLDPINGIFARYSNKEDYPFKPIQIIALELINSVKINNNIYFSKANYFYLEIKHSKNNVQWYCFRNAEIAQNWRNKLIDAVKYYKHFQKQYKTCNKKKDQKKTIQYFIYEMQLSNKIKILEYEDNQLLIQNNNQNSSNFLNFRPDQQFSYTKNQKKLSDFKILHCIGKGSFGYVFKVEFENRVYALKQQDKQRLKQSNNLQYVLTEVKIMRTINHPFIVKYFMSFQTTKNLYLVLEFLQQGDLAMYMTRGVILDEIVSKLLIGQIILAIEHLHKHNILYRDLKPENICISSDGYIKLIDFGLCKFITENELTFTICGSPAYLAPEVLNNIGMSRSTDIYQIGLLLYEMLTGYPPFYTRDLNVLINKIKSEPIIIPQNLSSDAQDILSSILKRSALERISLEQMKKHQFFKGLDWILLEKKEIKIPQLIQRFSQSKRATGDLIDSGNCLDDYIQNWDFSNN
ncbi:unnamed protein product [Paramecium sonneborni]|uniref:Protein kinase domain-containing protein n=1 Tax=Paramecium sonneborni TaxID=65129 RepID=A0A8S1KQ12_9CILI|nr:unnamed protein product [Paramecium sonneborni]